METYLEAMQDAVVEAVFENSRAIVGLLVA